MRKKRETAEIKAWREILVTSEADLELAKGGLQAARELVRAKESILGLVEQNVNRTRAKLAELEGMDRL